MGVRVNLIPEVLLVRRERRRHLRRWTVAASASLAVLVVPVATDWWRRAAAAELTTENARLQAELSELRRETVAFAGRSSQARLQLQRADALRAKRPWSSLLALLTDRTPPGCWYTTIATDPAAPAAAATPRPATSPPAAGGPTPANGQPMVASKMKRTIEIDAPRKLRLTGFATGPSDPHQLVTNLKNSGAFAQVVLEQSRLEQTAGGAYFRFELVCEW